MLVLARMAQIGNENVGLYARRVDPLAEMISGGGGRDEARGGMARPRRPRRVGWGCGG